jgi:murein L,D-transpeptidase YcbB/YkuD
MSRFIVLTGLLFALLFLSNNAQAAQSNKLPVWFDKAGITQSGQYAIAFLRTSELHGIDSERYLHKDFSEIKQTRDNKKLLEINEQLTHSLILYLLDLKYGLQGEKAILSKGSNSDSSSYKDYFASVLSIIAVTDNFDNIIVSYIDESDAYWKLQKSLLSLRAMQNSVPDDNISIGKSIKLGDSSTAVPALRAKLAAINNLGNSTSNSDIYDEALLEEVKEFQRVNGLDTDGVVGQKTALRLNSYIPFAISQINLTLDKIRSDDEDMQDRQVIINIPAFELSAYSDGKKEFSMPVVVGQKSRATPEFSNHINRVVFNPEWFPTQRIVREDLLPKMRNNPNYFANGGYKVTWRNSGQQISSSEHQHVDWNNVSHNDIQIVQSKGAGNALGVVKFLMPNNDSIYMHDTNHKELFANNYRALSSGCIRLSEPLKMANFVFGGDKAENKTFDEIISAKAQKNLNIDNVVKVKTIYHTAWVDDVGKFQVRDDIYGKFSKLQMAMKKNKLEKEIALISPTYPSSDWASVEMDEFASLVLPNAP